MLNIGYRRLPAVLFAGLVCLLSAGASAEEQVAVDLELVLAVDVSGSVDGHEARLQREGYVAALRSPELVKTIEAGIIGRIAVTYVEWAGLDHQFTIIDWAVIQDKASAGRFADALAAAPVNAGPWTSISGLINFALALFERNSVRGTRRVIDISGDGPNNSGPLVTLARDAAVRRGVVINGLPIVNDRLQIFGRRQMPNLDLYYADCVIGGPGAFLVVAEDFNDFARAIRRKLIFEIAGVAPPGSRQAGRAPVSGPLHIAFEGGCDIGERRLRERGIFPDSDF